MDIITSIKALSLIPEITNRLIRPTEEKTFIKIDLELPTLELRLESQVPHRTLTLRYATVVSIHQLLMLFCFFDEYTLLVKLHHASLRVHLFKFRRNDPHTFLAVALLVVFLEQGSFVIKSLE